MISRIRKNMFRVRPSLDYDRYRIGYIYLGVVHLLAYEECDWDLEEVEEYGYHYNEIPMRV